MTGIRRTDPPDFRVLFEALPGLYLILDRELVIVAASDAWLKATMTVRAAVIGRTILEVFPENPAATTDAAAGSATLRASLERVRELGVPDVMAILRYDIRAPEGGGFIERYWTPVNSPMLDADGRVAYIINRVEDVTAYVLLQRRQQERERQAEALQARASVLESEVFARSQEVARVNGELVAEMERRHAAQLQLEGESAKLAATHAALVALQRSRDLLTGMIVHDLRNPLTAALGYLDLLHARTAGADAQATTWVTSLQRVNNALMAMINGIVDVMRMEDAKMPVKAAPADIAALIAGKLQEYSGASAKNGLALAYRGPPALRFTTDATLLGRVLDNLVVNAIKHTPTGGSVTIAADQDAAHGALVLEIIDTGEGIAPADLGRLFQKYGRVEGQTMGRQYDTGLGLVFCRMAVELLRGDLAVASTLGQGSTFTITLPAPAEQRIG